MTGMKMPGGTIVAPGRKVHGYPGRTRLLRLRHPWLRLRSLPSLAFRRRPWRLFLAIRSAARSLLVLRARAATEKARYGKIRRACTRHGSPSVTVCEPSRDRLNRRSGSGSSTCPRLATVAPP